MLELMQRDNRHMMQVYSPEPMVMARGEGMYLYDTRGRAYLDFSAQFSAAGLGHAHPELCEAIAEQMRRLCSVTTMFVTEERVRLAEQLAALAPQGLDKVLFGCTGSDANEFALKCAKYVRGGGRIITFRRGFHGSTAGSAGATGKSETIQEDAAISQLLPPGFLHAAPAYCYRCDFGRDYPDCGLHCLNDLEKQMRQEDGGRIAAVMTEPIFAAGGVIVPPDGFYTGLRELCDRYGALLIFDEVVTGIGRTGAMFACEHWGITPDILVTGKALTGGYIPGSAVLATREIGEAMDELTLHGHTHSCYPVMCAAASKNLEIIERDGLVARSARVGQHLIDALRALREEFSCLGDVRGRGLLIGLEIVAGRESREADHQRGRALFETMLTHGLITELESRKNLENCVIVLHPPLITSEEDADRAVEIIRSALEQVG